MRFYLQMAPAKEKKFRIPYMCGLQFVLEIRMKLNDLQKMKE